MFITRTHRYLLTGLIGCIDQVRFIEHDFVLKPVDINTKPKRKHTDIPFWCKRK